jgi:hypothetical protein
MRNDARPIGGHSSHQSPVVSDRSPDGRRSEVINHRTGIYRPRPESPVDDKEPLLLDFDGDDLVMPANDATLPTRI